MATPKVVPCRLYVILAREAPVGIIFRRGPTRWAQIIKWNTDTDTFEPGQWFHGKLDGEEADLSPDGTLLLYSAEKVNAHTMADKEHTSAWTAISKLPYLTALALWPNGVSWGGSGLFLTNTRVWLEYSSDAAHPHPDHKPQGLEVTGNVSDGPSVPISWRRLQRDGWMGLPRMDSMAAEDFFSSFILRKQNPRGKQILTRMDQVTLGRYCANYSVRDAHGDSHVLKNAVWADWDQRGRLVYARDGKIFTAAVGDDGLDQEQELADFNGNKFEELEAPDWAKVW